MKADDSIVERECGRLYVVATPIGNLADISARAIETLRQADVILAEDTRVTRKLLNHYGISTPLRSCNEQNEEERLQWLLTRLEENQQIALVSDAGTPLISDPGFRLIRELRQRKISAIPVPGPCALIAALSVAGIATTSFLFDGFLPNKSNLRKHQLQSYKYESRTIVVYESSHRILASLQDMAAVFGDERKLFVGRELTKKYESLYDGTAAQILQYLEQKPTECKGEFVVVIDADTDTADLHDAESVLRVLINELPPNKAAKLTAQICDKKKRDMYELAMTLKQR